MALSQFLSPPHAHTALALICLFVCEAASALSCVVPRFTLDEAYRQADSIIIGLVTECTETQGVDLWTGGGDDCSFVALEVLKDSRPARDYGGVASSSGCGLSLHVGNRYLMFLDKNNVPLYYSEPLKAASWSNRLLEPRLRLLREYRDGRTNDLSEPWTAQKGPIQGRNPLREP